MFPMTFPEPRSTPLRVRSILTLPPAWILRPIAFATAALTSSISPPSGGSLSIAFGSRAPRFPPLVEGDWERANPVDDRQHRVLMSARLRSDALVDMLVELIEADVTPVPGRLAPQALDQGLTEVGVGVLAGEVGILGRAARGD